VVILQFTIPYGNRAIRALIILLMFIWLLFQVQIEAGYVSPFDLGVYADAFSYFNITLTFLATIIELSIENFMKKLILHYNNIRLAELEDQAHTDPLTRLFNRRYATLFFEKLKKEASPAPWCVAMLDIDDFKKINDSRGHAVGDLVLMELAARLQHSLRKTDMIFRWGGEEFLILLENTNIPAAFIILDKIRANLASSEEIRQKLELQFTVTIGVSPLDLNAVETSIDISDQKLYEGKNSGKNKVVI
jgi:diguanylate cyclase (GGDEF)-like protein